MNIFTDDKLNNACKHLGLYDKAKLYTDDDTYIILFNSVAKRDIHMSSSPTSWTIIFLYVRPSSRIFWVGGTTNASTSTFLETAEAYHRAVAFINEAELIPFMNDKQH